MKYILRNFIVHNALNVWDLGFERHPHHACVSVIIEFLCNDFQKIGNFHYILTTPKEAGVGGLSSSLPSTKNMHSSSIRSYEAII